MYLTVRSGTSPLGDVPGGLQCSEKSEQMLRRIAEIHSPQGEVPGGLSL